MSILLHVEPYLNQAVSSQKNQVSSAGDSLSNASILNVDAASVAQNFNPLGIDLLNTSGTIKSTTTPAFRGTESDHIAPEIQPFQLPASVPSSTATASDNAMMEALLRGLGLPDLPLNSTPVEFAQAVGSMLRASTEGTMNIFKVHAITRHESGLNISVLDNLANNPLNFFLNADAALTHLLSHLDTNQMPPAQAYVNAYNDLKAHEMAMMTGMRAALDGMLEQFDPAVIEQQTPESTVMDKLVVYRRKAHLWDDLVTLHNAIKAAGHDEFQFLFDEQFNQAYEEQMMRSKYSEKLKKMQSQDRSVV